MSREWKPGDLAYIGGDGEFVSFDLKSVVLIDPTSREQVERLAKALYPDSDGTSLNILVAIFTKALREFANPKPPKPDEPMGLGAVVRDDSSRAVWTAIAAMGGVDRWSCPNGERREWADLPCQITILSPGWEADQ